MTSNATTKANTVMHIRDLHVSFDVPGGRLRAVDGVDLDLRRGEILAIVGESGSGKSALSLALVGLNRGPSTRITGTVEFGGRNLVEASEAQLREVRGRDVAVVFQDALAALNPLHRAGAQVAEMVRLHQPVSRAAAWERAERLLDDVGIASPASAARAYPHQLSGGMRQRVMIAMGLANDPAVLIADEPTTALDVTIQAQILDLMRELKRTSDAAIILITHDLGVVAEVCDEVAVMYAGEIVERAPADALFEAPEHPYTVGLLASIPRLDERAERLAAIDGVLPDMTAPPIGCRFADRCPFVLEECRAAPPPVIDLGGRWSRCLRAPLERLVA